MSITHFSLYILPLPWGPIGINQGIDSSCISYSGNADFPTVFITLGLSRVPENAYCACMDWCRWYFVFCPSLWDTDLDTWNPSRKRARKKWHLSNSEFLIPCLEYKEGGGERKAVDNLILPHSVTRLKTCVLWRLRAACQGCRLGKPFCQRSVPTKRARIDLEFGSN